MFRVDKNEQMTLHLLNELLQEHTHEIKNRYEKLLNAYTSEHDILKAAPKPKYKPDNRIVVNFPKYIVDTFNGFFIGNAVKTNSDDAKVSEYVNYLDKYNDQDDNNAELSKICSIFGKGFEMYFTDEQAELCITYLNPIEAFMVYDESILERPLYFVRRYTDRDKNEFGSISDSYGVRNFKVTGGLKWLDDWQPHHFNGVPAVEFIENEERQGIFEPALPMVNALNKAISEKANDVDYFADAYLKVLGVPIDDEDLKFIRDSRIINLFGDEELANKVVAEFMDKPNNDTSQENLLNRLERLIFQVSMVANISDENFGNQSGIALRYKLQAMHNLFKNKQRKFESGLNRRYKLLFSHPASKVPADSWLHIDYTFTPNIPQNLLEEAQIAAQMEGITSHKTQLKVMSIVDNVDAELERIDEENTPPATTIVDDMMFGVAEENSVIENAGGAAQVQGKSLNGAQTQSLIAIMAQFSAGSLSEGQAVNLISTAIGISKPEARAILNGELTE